MARFNLIEEKADDLPEIDGNSPRKKPRFQLISQNLTAKDYAKDFAKQGAKGAATGFGGAYGDILDLPHLQTRERQTPQEKERVSREFKTLEDIEKTDRPSFSQLEQLSDESLLPRNIRLPSSSETEQLIEMVGGPGKPETAAGRYGNRMGRFGGAAAAFGGGGMAPSLAAGAAGQTAEEVGAPPWVQAAVEIATMLKLGKSAKPVTSSSPEVQAQLDKLKKLGFTEQDITLAKNALEERGWLKKSAAPSAATEKAFAESAQRAEEIAKNVVEDTFNGLFTEGTAPFEEAATNLFTQLEGAASKVDVKDPELFYQAATKAINQLNKTLAPPEQKKATIKLLEEALEKAYSGVTGDYFTNFYKDLGAVGNWSNPKQREHILGIIKDSIKKTLASQGKEGKEAAQLLDKANKSYIKLLNARDTSDLFAKVMTEDGLNFKKLLTQVDNPTNRQMLKRAIGDEATSNLRQIAKSASDIKGLEKTINGSQFKSAFKDAKLLYLAKSIVTFDLRGIGAIAMTLGTSQMATKLLTEPKFQNLAIKLIDAVKRNAPNAAAAASREIQEAVEKQGDKRQSKQKKRYKAVD